MSAKIGAIFRPHERQAPIIRPATEGGDCEAGRLAVKGESGGRRYVWVPAAEARSFCTEDPAGRVVPATGEYRVAPGERGEGPRHPASARKSQHNYPAKALRAVGDGVGRAEPLAPALQLSPSTATETKKGGVRQPPRGVSGLEGQGTSECPQLVAHLPVGTFVLVAPERAFAWPSWFSG